MQMIFFLQQNNYVAIMGTLNANVNRQLPDREKQS